MFGAARPRDGHRDDAERRVQRPLFEALPAGALRHRDHRFEWTRAEFAGVGATASRHAHGYRVRFLPVGPEDAEVGPPTQMAVFER